MFPSTIYQWRTRPDYGYTQVLLDVANNVSISPTGESADVRPDGDVNLYRQAARLFALVKEENAQESFGLTQGGVASPPPPIPNGA